MTGIASQVSTAKGLRRVLNVAHPPATAGGTDLSCTLKDGQEK
jgi:hypothetical protein